MLTFAGLPVLHRPAVVVAIGWMPPDSLETASMFGALFLVSVVIVIGTISLRKRRRARRSHHHQSPRPAPRNSPEPEAKFALMTRRQRRRRREHRPRNPTLAETGGLPPLRQDNPPPTPSQT